MASIFDIEPNIPSTDINSYIVTLYGLPKTGKTTFAIDSGECFIAGFETGYKALPGALGMPINTWVGWKNVIKELKTQKAKERYKVVAIDTVGVALQQCEDYILQQHGVSQLSDIPFSQGWKMVEKEFSKVIRSVIAEGYGVIIIAHAEEKEDFINKVTKIMIKATNQGRAVINQVTDILAYIHVKPDGSRVLRLREPRIAEAGTRFSKLPEEIPFTYKDLADAVAIAVQAEAKARGCECTDERRVYDRPEEEYDFTAILAETRTLCEEIVNANPELGKAVVGVIERNFKKGFSLAEATASQAELVAQTLQDLRQLQSNL